MPRKTLISFCLASAPVLAGPTDGEIRSELIRRFIASHPVCACPYSTDVDGKYCGAKSAWAHPGAAVPACYVEDITLEMLDEYRSQPVSTEE